MRTIRETITPDLAMKMLERNTGNRPLRMQHIADLAAIICMGLWRVSHQGIAFAPDGTLIDGQHRLWAVVEAGMPVEMMVTYDADPETFGIIDNGVVRTPSDRTGRPAYIVAISGALILSIARTSFKVPNRLHETALGSYGAEVQACGTVARRSGSPAPMRAGFVLRMKAEPERAEALLQMLRMYVNGDQDMPPQLWALQRRMATEKAAGRDILMRTFASLDNARLEYPKLTPMNADAVSKEILQIHRRHAPELFSQVTMFIGNINRYRSKYYRKGVGEVQVLRAVS